MRKAKKILSGVLVLTLMLTMLPVAAKASGGSTMQSVSIAEGEPVTINWTEGESEPLCGQVVNVDPGSSVIPAEFLLWVEGTNVSVTRTVGSGSPSAVTSNGTETYTDEDTGITSTHNAYTIQTNATSSVTVNVTIGTSAYGNAGTYEITCPVQHLPSGGVNPSVVHGYLPVGQFARPNSFGWGGICTDGTNTGSEYKFTNGYVSTGVSLGMAGGYVQFDMGTNNAITNDSTNPYGIDFVIYGNAFAGNPEAGSVMVSQDGTTWYELAGSRYYNADTQKNVNVSYINIGAAGKTFTANGYSSTFTKKGVYYSKDYVPSNSYSAAQANAAIAEATWYCIPTSTTVNSPVPSNSSSASTVSQSYWPELNGTGEMYQGVWKMSDKVDNVYYCTAGDAQVITYKGITIVPDSDTNSYYQFGYFDTHINGSSYGTAVNPYTIANDGTGGDGFDLSWAVDTAGNPVKVTTARYVRVYSSVLYNAGAFGETSAELCGIYKTSNVISSGAGITGCASISASSGNITNQNVVYNVLKKTTIQVPSNSDSTEISVSSEASNVYLNDQKVNSGQTTTTINRADGSIQYFRVITQNALKQASVVVVKVEFQ